MELIDKAAIVEEIKKRIRMDISVNACSRESAAMYRTQCHTLMSILTFINTLEVIEPHKNLIQYDSIKAGIESFAETYSFNIESELFQQLTKEQQELWRKEIEQACISGSDAGIELARDVRYKEILEVKEVDLDREIRRYRMNNLIIGHKEGSLYNYMTNVAKHFFELGLKSQNVISSDKN